MSKSNRERILAGVEAEDFIGRENESDALLRHATENRDARGLLLSAAPSLGASELLRQTYDRLFTDQTDTIPFYFSIRKQDKTAQHAAVRFLQTFLQQAVAFRRRNARILDASPDVCEISELALPSETLD